MIIRRLALLLALLCGVAGATVRAEEDLNRSSENAMSARIDQLEAEIAALRRQPTAEMPAPHSGPAYGGGEGYFGGPEGCGCAGGCGGAPDCCCEDDCCCSSGCWHAPCSSSGFYGGGEAIWVQPRWRGFDAVAVTVNNGVIVASNTQGFDYDYDPTARFWVGYTGANGLGLRTSWWKYDHDSNDLEVTIPTAPPTVIAAGPLGLSVTTPGNRFRADQSLELQTWDFEMTSCFEACGGNIVAGFGLRYATYHVTTSEARLNSVGTVLESRDLNEHFEGWGPTLGLEFVRPLCFSGFSFYSNLRGSVFLGQEHQTARRFGLAGLTDIASRDADEPLGIAELQIALQWCCCGWFARAGWQAQYWDDMAGDRPPPANAGNFSPPGGGGSSNTRADLSVQGLFFAAGAQF